MAQLREKIRIMVRNEFVSRLLAEAEDDKKDEKVYHSSNYEIIWDKFESGTKSQEISKKPSKNDFIRWFLKTYIISPSSSLKLDNNDTKKVMNMYDEAKNPDEFIEEINLNRWIFANSNFSRDADPVFKMVKAYKDAKDFGGTHIDYGQLHAAMADKSMGEEGEEGEGVARTYDTAKDADAAKTTIADMLAGDATETTTKQSVLNRIESALKHVSGDEGMLALLSDFLKNQSTDQDAKMDAKDMLVRLNKIVNSSIDKYSSMFSDAMINAFKGVGEDDEQAQQKAFAEGIADFTDELRKQGVKSLGSQEIDVFNDVITRMAGGGKDVLDMIIQVANNPDESSSYIDEIISALYEGFKSEMDKRTNFNSLGDFIDQNPEVREIRKDLKSIALRGRPTGSTAASVAARKSKA
jgi:hypothetical protein